MNASAPVKGGPAAMPGTAKKPAVRISFSTGLVRAQRRDSSPANSAAFREEISPATFRNDFRNGDLVLRDDTEISIDQTDSAHSPPLLLTPGRFTASLHDVLAPVAIRNTC